MAVFFLLIFCLVLIITPWIGKLANKFGIVDKPSADKLRKVHKKETPLLGGVAIFLSFFIVLWAVYFVHPAVFLHLTKTQLISLTSGSIILMLGGFLDDKYSLRPRFQIIFPILAALAIVFGGVSLKEITNPFGGIFNLNSIHFESYFFLADVVVFLWLMGMMYTTKLLDGLDGLVAGLTAIGSIMICFLSLTSKFYQPDIAFVSGIFAVANLGFLIFNFYPAKIFLGEGGSLMSGYILGVLSIVAGGKIATTLLVMGVAALDVFMVIIRRLFKKQSLFVGDAAHLHHRLFKVGFSQRQIVLSFYFFGIVFGMLTLFLQSKGKLLAIIALFVIAIIIGIVVDKKRL